MKRKTTEAKASLISMRSMSDSFMPAFFSTLCVTSIGPVSMIAGSEPILAKRLDPRARLQAGGFARFRTADQHRGGAVDDAGRIAGVVHVGNRLDLRMRLHRHRVEAAHLAHLHEGRLQRGQRLHGRRRPHVLVLVEDGEAVDVLDRR